MIRESKETTDPSTWDDRGIDYEWLEEEPHNVFNPERYPNLKIYNFTTGNVFLYKGKYLAQQGPTRYIEVYHPIPKEVEDYWKEWDDWDYVKYASNTGLSKEQESKMREAKKPEGIKKYMVIRKATIGSSLGEDVANVEPVVVYSFDNKEDADSKVELLNSSVTPEEKDLMGTEYSVEEKTIEVTEPEHYEDDKDLKKEPEKI